MKWTTALIVPALLLAAGACRADSKIESDIRRSVVRISASQRYPNLLKPWMKNNPRQVACPGVVLDGQRILTNAHLVTDAKQIYVEPYQSSDKLAATVERITSGIAPTHLANRGSASEGHEESGKWTTKWDC